MKLLHYIFTFLIAFGALWTHAQKLEVIARLDTNEILIGDQITLELKAQFRSGLNISWPIFQDTITKNIEIIEATLPDTIESHTPGIKAMLQKIRITSFDSGVHIIPPLSFLYIQEGDTLTNSASTLPQYLKVNTVEIDSTKNIMPIKPPLAAPYTFREALPWIIAIVVAGLLAWFLYYYFKKRKKHQPLFAARPKPKLPPHIIALNDLEELRYKKLWQNNKYKEYYTIMTDIVREYIEERFQVPAIEMTTDEILNGLKNEQSINSDAMDKVKQTLRLADLVKFAKEKPLPLENDLSLNNSIDFVRETIQKVEESQAESENDGTEITITKEENV